MSTQQLVSVMGKKTQVNPMLMKNDMSFVQSLYDTGVAPVQGTVTNKNKDMFQNEERIQSMISNGNLDYVSKAGFIKYQAVAATEDVVLNGTYNTLYTIRNSNSPAIGIDIAIKFLAGTIDVFPSPVFPFNLPAGQAVHIMVDGVGTPRLATSAEITPALGVIAASSALL